MSRQQHIVHHARRTATGAGYCSFGIGVLYAVHAASAFIFAALSMLPLR